MYTVKTKVKNKLNNESEITGGFYLWDQLPYWFIEGHYLPKKEGQFPEDCFGPPKCPAFAFVHHLLALPFVDV